MANLIEIIVRAKDEASGALKNVSGSLDELQGNAQAAIIPLTAIAAVGTAIIGKMTMTAARTEELGIVVENLGRVAGYGVEELAAVEESITSLGITTQGARTIMSRFMGAQLDLADASKIARAAQDLAVIGMQDSSVAAENLTYALASMQPRVLRQYGLFVDLNEAYEMAAKELGKTASELTETEKRQAMLNMTLEQAARYTGTYEAAQTTAWKQLRSFSRYTEELSNELGQFFLPILSRVVQAATVLIKALIDLPAPVKAVIAAVGGLITTFAGLLAGGAGLIILIPKVAALGGALAALASGPIGWAVLAIMGLIAAAAALYTAWVNNWGGIQDKVYAVRDALRPIFDELMETLRWFWEEMKPRLLEAWAAVSDWIQGTAIPAFRELWNELEPVREVIGRITIALLKFMASSFIRSLKVWLQGVIVLFDLMAATIGGVISAIQTLIGWIDRAISAWHRLQAAGVEQGAGLRGRPGLQMGLAYVPTTMPATLHQGEAVLTREQAEIWRNQMNVHIGNIYGMDGFEEEMNRYWDRATRYAI